jgi:hypothetical protein
MKKQHYSTPFNFDDTSTEAKLWAALHCTEGAEERLGLLIAESTDADVKAAISREFGLGGGSSSHGGHSHKGGNNPILLDRGGKPLLKGKDLIEATRRLLGIDDPAKNAVTMTAGDKSVTVDADKFDAIANSAAALAEAKKGASKEKKLPLFQRVELTEEEVRCVRTWNYKTCRVVTVRMDTGAIVEDRAMSADERQETLFPEENP